MAAVDACTLFPVPGYLSAIPPGKELPSQLVRYAGVPAFAEGVEDRSNHAAA
jgi:hypothetical protein